jgi:NADH dehydrogenase [ubiquinone] 1 alpha subcomplex assembly factor 7
MTPLEVEIRRIIAVDGPMPLGRFMTLCLAHPVHGYYVTRDPLGAAGDFVTAPEISQMFGELIGLWVACVWQQMGSPDNLALVELGPGRGTLMADALRAAKVVPEFLASIDVHLVETSPVLRQYQGRTLAGLGLPLSWHRDFAEVPERPLIVIANEFFDALPIEQAVCGDDGWHQRLVGTDADGRLVLALAPDRMPAAVIPDHLRGAPTGSLYEWRSDRPVTELSERIVRHGGAALVIDYGHVESATGETLQAVGGHAFAHPLARPGEVDLTAHVDFAALARTAVRTGARVHGPISQAAFLRALGIETRAAALKRATKHGEIDAAVARLIGPGPDAMGELFKAVAVADRRLGPLPGFT